LCESAVLSTWTLLVYRSRRCFARTGSGYGSSARMLILQVTGRKRSDLPSPSGLDDLWVASHPDPHALISEHVQSSTPHHENVTFPESISNPLRRSPSPPKRRPCTRRNPSKPLSFPRNPSNPSQTPIVHLPTTGPTRTSLSARSSSSSPPSSPLASFGSSGRSPPRRAEEGWAGREGGRGRRSM
jgi:hypothetical protein